MERTIRDRTIVLASASPRRRETLERLGFPLVLRPTDSDESVADRLPVPERVVELAALKARAAAASPGAAGAQDGRWVLGADTLVALDGIAYGKPSGEEEAGNMLRALAGREHEVATGLALIDLDSGRLFTALSETLVRFAPMSEGEISAYLATGEWRGAAGAYRIQDRAAFFIDRVDGSFSGVVGLPIRELYVILRRSAYPFTGIPPVSGGSAREP